VCARGDGIRRSKDLRAEIGKFPNLTNERKQMSTKTMKQRIAVLAVSVLTAGVFSVISSPAANAAVDVGDIDFASQTGGVNAAICTSTNGAAFGLTVATAKSGGDVRLVGTGVANGDANYFALTGPAVWVSTTLPSGAQQTTGGLPTVTSTTITNTSDAVGALYNLRLTGVGTVTVTYTTAATAAAVDVITITSVAACANGVYSSTYSSVMMDSVVDQNASSNVDAVTSATAGSPVYIKLDLEDGNDVQITTGTITASATNGALLTATTVGTAGLTGSLSSVNATPGADAGTAGGNTMIRVNPAQTATTSTTVVTITHNGSAVASKSITFFGEQAKIVIGAITSGKTSDADDGSVLFTYQDSAGNTVPGAVASFVAASATTTITQAASIKAPTSSSISIAATGLNDRIESKLGGKTASGVMTYGCGSSSADATFSIATVSTVNANVITAEVKGSCNGSVSTFTVSTDKASYNIGDVATITIEAKDSSGRPATDTEMLQLGAISVGGGTLNTALLGTDAAAVVEGFRAGKVSVRAQMTTEGSFNTVVSHTGSVTNNATTGYKVVNAATVGAVSNADVLKSIVALIASINKQIAALQKLILARR